SHPSPIPSHPTPNPILSPPSHPIPHPSHPSNTIPSIPIPSQSHSRSHRAHSAPCPSVCRCAGGRVYCNDRGLTAVPEGVPWLERLDLSDNNLTTLPRGLFDDLNRLSHLGLRNNPWFCGCNLAWLRDWVRRRTAGGLEVRGLLCQAPARLRGLPVGELRGEMDACGTPAPVNGAPGVSRGGGVMGLLAASRRRRAAAGAENGARHGEVGGRGWEGFCNEGGGCCITKGGGL
uniref:Uncharacterized protein n=1 Tax=Coturnix japonica TaxID=93934 RepID=A0A8C2STF3_COTJA